MSLPDLCILLLISAWGWRLHYPLLALHAPNSWQLSCIVGIVGIKFKQERNMRGIKKRTISLFLLQCYIGGVLWLLSHRNLNMDNRSCLTTNLLRKLVCKKKMRRVLFRAALPCRWRRFHQWHYSQWSVWRGGVCKLGVHQKRLSRKIVLSPL